MQIKCLQLELGRLRSVPLDIIGAQCGYKIVLKITTTIIEEHLESRMQSLDLIFLNLMCAYDFNICMSTFNHDKHLNDVP